MINLTKISGALTPAASQARLYYDSTKNSLVYIDENGAKWYYGEQCCKLTADMSAFVSTTLADVTGLSFPVLPGVFYAFEFCLLYSSAALATGVRVALTGPASPTTISASVTIHGAGADGTGATFLGTLKAYAATDSVVSPQVEEVGVVYPVFIRGRLINGVNAGTLQLQMASETTNGVTPKAGSDGRLWYP